MQHRSALVTSAAAVGYAVAAVFGVVAGVTRRKPLHAVGHLADATLTIDGQPQPLGVPLLDTPAVYRPLVRVSRGGGLPAFLPDIAGLALRVVTDERSAPSELLFASTGSSSIGRYLPRLTWRRDGRVLLTTLLPLRGPHGAVQLALRPQDRSAFTLQISGATGPWCRLGRLTLHGARPDELVHFDPIGGTPTGLRTYRWVAAVRGPSYVIARRLVRAPRGGVPDASRC